MCRPLTQFARAQADRRVVSTLRAATAARDSAAQTNATERMRADWDARARENAEHYVASGRDDWDDAAFSAHGRASVEKHVVEDLAAIAGDVDPAGLVALEIGCGVGRMTEHLAAIFGQVYAVDVSPEMITRARLRLRRASNVDLHVTSGCDVACLADGSADFAFSFVVFQHVPSRDAIVSTIRDVHRVLRPGSLFKFQLQGSQDAGYLAAEKDTWLGATFTQDELDLVAAACGFDVVGAAGAGTQYFWQWWRRR